MSTFGILIMGAGTLFCAWVLMAAMRQRPVGALQHASAVPPTPIPSPGLRYFLMLLVAVIVGVELWGLYLSVIGYAKMPLQPVHALIILGVVVASALAALLLYLSSAEKRVARAA